MSENSAVVSYGVIAANYADKQIIKKLFGDTTVVKDENSDLIFQLAQDNDGEILGFGIELAVAADDKPTVLMPGALKRISEHLTRKVKSFLYNINIIREPELFLWVHHSEKS